MRKAVFQKNATHAILISEHFQKVYVLAEYKLPCKLVVVSAFASVAVSLSDNTSVYVYILCVCVLMYVQGVVCEAILKYTVPTLVNNNLIMLLFFPIRVCY